MQADSYAVLLRQGAGGGHGVEELAPTVEDRVRVSPWSSLPRQVSVVNALDMQVVVSTVPPTLVEEKKDQLIR